MKKCILFFCATFLFFVLDSFATENPQKDERTYVWKEVALSESGSYLSYFVLENKCFVMIGSDESIKIRAKRYSKKEGMSIWHEIVIEKDGSLYDKKIKKTGSKEEMTYSEVDDIFHSECRVAAEFLPREIKEMFRGWYGLGKTP